MFQNNRTILSNAGILTDLSIPLNDFQSASQVITSTASGDFLYIGSEFPFNHRWFELGSVPNAVVSIPKIEVWDGDAWAEVVEVIDQTSVAGATFAQSGIISWVPNNLESWNRQDTSAKDGSISPILGLENAIIYGLYWARISWSASLTATTELKLVGHKFSDEDDLGGLYPDLATTKAKTGFETGKTDWIEQEFRAAEMVIRNIRQKGLALSPNQILAWETWKDASTHKVAEIIYRAFGDDFSDNRRTARSDFEKAMDAEITNIDLNNNARLDQKEKTRTQGTLFR